MLRAPPRRSRPIRDLRIPSELHRHNPSFGPCSPSRGVLSSRHSWRRRRKLMGGIAHDSSLARLRERRKRARAFVAVAVAIGAFGTVLVGTEPPGAAAAAGGLT